MKRLIMLARKLLEHVGFDSAPGGLVSRPNPDTNIVQVEPQL